MTIKAVALDFDGTVVESVDTKTEAFRTLFAGEPELERIIALHIEQGGRSRYEKLKMIYHDILQRQPAPGEIDELGRRFGALVRDAVVACPFVRGAEVFLRRYADRLPLVLLSGTPHDELIEIVERRGLRSLFLEVHGSPPEKDTLLTDLLRRHRWAADDVLYLGDAVTDWRAAVSVGVRFVARVAPGDLNRFPEAVRTIPDLTLLDAMLDEFESTVSP